MAQLVNDHVTLINTMNNTAMDRDGVIAKFGVLRADYRSPALMGDKVDNIPGVAGGRKDGYRFIAASRRGSVDLRAAGRGSRTAHSWRQSLRRKLKVQKRTPTSAMSWRRLKRIAILALPRAILTQAPDQEAMIALFRELEFKTWLEALLQGTDGTKSPAANQQAEEVSVLSRDGQASRSR